MTVFLCQHLGHKAWQLGKNVWDCGSPRKYQKYGCHIFLCQILRHTTLESPLVPLWKVRPQASTEGEVINCHGKWCGPTFEIRHLGAVLWIFRSVWQYGYTIRLMRPPTETVWGEKQIFSCNNIQDNICPALFCSEFLHSCETSLESCGNLLSAASQLFNVVLLLPITMKVVGCFVFLLVFLAKHPGNFSCVLNMRLFLFRGTRWDVGRKYLRQILMRQNVMKCENWKRRTPLLKMTLPGLIKKYSSQIGPFKFDNVF